MRLKKILKEYDEIEKILLKSPKLTPKEAKALEERISELDRAAERFKNKNTPWQKSKKRKRVKR